MRKNVSILRKCHAGYFIAAIALATLPIVGGCASAGHSRNSPCNGCAVWQVGFATDRAIVAYPEYFSGSRAEVVRYGYAAVSIPPNHEPGHLEQRSLFWRLLHIPADPKTEFMIVDFQSLDRSNFSLLLESELRRASKRDVLLFIHGFNTTFTESVLRTAQLAFDVRFPGVAIAYSWPSLGAASNFAYHSDEESAQFTAPHLKDFLERLTSTPGVEKIHVIAHSMGNRPLVSALAQLRQEQPNRTLRIQHIVLAAPDISVDVFRGVFGAIRSAADHITLYASSQDKALLASDVDHGFGSRLGQAGQHLTILDGMDTIDASKLDTSFERFIRLEHSLVFSLALVDLRLLLEGNPVPRPFLIPRSMNGKRFWEARLPAQ